METYNKPMEGNVKQQELIRRAERIRESFKADYDFDPAQFYCFSKDMLRIDVGLIIQRAPIFMRFREREMNFMHNREKLMEEYYCDTKQFINEIKDVSKLNENVMAKVPYHSDMNTDNHPTHKWVDKETNKEMEYSPASKKWDLVDPHCKDMKSIHYAGEDRTFLIVKNKYTGEWEFPVTKVMFGETFFKAKLKLFNTLTDNQWRITFFGSSPILHTLREFTPAEDKDRLNEDLKGVRTYWFGANHRRGLPLMTIEPESPEQRDDVDYDDWMWVPKRQLNEYMERDHYEIFS